MAAATGVPAHDPTRPLPTLLSCLPLVLQGQRACWWTCCDGAQTLDLSSFSTRQPPCGRCQTFHALANSNGPKAVEDEMSAMSARLSEEARYCCTQPRCASDVCGMDMVTGRLGLWARARACLTLTYTHAHSGSVRCQFAARCWGKVSMHWCAAAGWGNMGGFDHTLPALQC